MMPSAKLRQNAPEAVPVIVLARLAVDRNYQGAGIGRGLLQDAILRSAHASTAVGVRAVPVHAIDDAAAAFYAVHRFIASPTEPRTLLLPIETAVVAMLP